MQLSILSTTGGAAKGNLDVADTVFGVPYNEPMIHQVVTAFQAAARSGTKAQKTRAEVRGGGAKPWRQKGTGSARAGTSRGPLWRGGGRAFAARPRDYSQKVNRKVYRGAMRSILAELLRQGRLLVVDQFEPESPKTKQLLALLNGLNVSDVLIVADELGENLWLAARNVPSIGLADVAAIDPVILMAYDNVVVTEAAIRKIEEQLQ
ncbi:MAG: 50S ribosomal protein L4 [Gammaproteobacteria bacterium]|nr:50S ribosomal protein L4 [Gammaproteobacteria bacterium]